MTKDEKLTRLLEMQEHPDRYTEEEIRQLMADEECRQLYNAMVRATDAIFMEKLNGQGVEPEASPSKPSTLLSFSPVLRKIAAVAIGVLMLSGIAYAAVQIIRSQEAEVEKQEAVVSTNTQHQSANAQTPADSTQTKPTVYEDAELATILNEIATFHQCEVVYKNEASKHLRLYFTWNQKATIDDIVGTFNKFERIHITRDNKKLIVE